MARREWIKFGCGVILPSALLLLLFVGPNLLLIGIDCYLPVPGEDEPRDVPDGLVVDRYPGGGIKEAAGSKDGWKDGVSRGWSPSGAPWWTGSFERGKRSGQWLRWGDSGVLVGKELYVNGEAILHSSWDEEGNLRYRSRPTGDACELVEKWDDGRLVFAGLLLRGQR